MKTERDKFLTEAMGGCWHELVDPGTGLIFGPNYRAPECSCGKTLSRMTPLHNNPDFSTWQGFGKLWTWAKEQGWWEGFLFDLGSINIRTRDQLVIHPDYINPDHFADAIYDFLKDRP